MQTLKYAMRMLLKNPVVTLVSIVTLALGIGANTAIFSVINGVLLQPLPYKSPERLVALWENVPGYGRWRAAPANFLDWKKQNTTFEDIAAYSFSSLTVTGDGEPEQLLGTRVSSGYFSVVGVEPIRGRSFLPDEYETGKGQVVILGYSLWQRRYGGDENILSKSILLDGASYQVVGVMGPGLYPVTPTTSGRINFDEAQQDYWIPLTFTADWVAARSSHVLGVVGRLKPEVTLDQAIADMNTIGARLEQEYAADKGEGIIVSAFMNELVGDVRPALLMLMFSVGLVLLIACANIAGLLLAQHAARSKEIAIRAALGANRFRLVYQFFVEGLILSLLGALAGIGLAALGMNLLLKLIPAGIPRLDLVRIDWRVLCFTTGLSLLTCLAFALVPAWQASKPNLQSTLEQSGRTSGPGAGRLRFRQLLVVVQVAMAVVLVIGAGLLIKSFWRLQQVDPGFQPQHVLTLDITLPASKYITPEDKNHFFDQLTNAIGKLPGVLSASIAYDHPLVSNWVDSFKIEGNVSSSEEESPTANFNPVSVEYFRTVGMQLVRGRGFTEQDDSNHPGVAVVNESFVRKFFPNENPLGRHIEPGPPGRIWKKQRLTSFEIVGVVHDVKSSGLQAPSEPTYYLPASQAPLGDMSLLVRTTTEPTAIVPAIRQAVLAIDPSQPISNVNTMQKILSDSIARPRLNMLLMGLFGALAMLLAMVGIYGLLSYAVTQRTHEMGIRMALGAQISDVLTLVLRQGMTLAFVGEGIGLLLALALTRVMQRFLFGVTPTDVGIFVSVVGVLTSTALLACYLPARRAARVDPLVALRYE